MTWRNAATFVLGSIAVVLAAVFGPLYNRVHRLSKENR